MRLFPGDEVPGLTAFVGEMRAPWILPPSFPRSHRRRLAILVGRAACAFDPQLRFIELRWADRWLLARGALRVPPRPLIWWRISAVTDNPTEVLSAAPQLVQGSCLLDFEADPGVTSLGWMGPLKVRLLERINDILLDEAPLAEPEPVLDALDDAARHLVSPIDLLDFAERLIAQRASGLNLEEARADAIAAVLAARLDAEAASPEAVSRFVAALQAAVEAGPLPAEAHAELHTRGFAEASPDVRPPVLEWVARPVVLERAERWLRAGQRPSAWPPVAAPVPPAVIPPPPAAPDEEAAATAVLEEIRAGADRQWDPQRRIDAAHTLILFAKQLDEKRGDVLDPALLEQAAALLDTAARLAGDAGDDELAARTLSWTAQNYLAAHLFPQCVEALQRASAFAERAGDAQTRADVLKVTGGLSMWMDDLAAAKAAYEAALPMYQGTGDRLGEANVLKATGDLSLRMADLAGAKAAYEAALQIYRGIGARGGEANVLKATGDLSLRMADLAGAKAAYEAALQIYGGIGTRLGEANALRGEGLTRLLLEHRVPEELDASMKLADSIDDQHGAWLSRTAIAAASRDAATLEKARAYFASAGLALEADLAEELAQVLDDPVAVFEILRQLPTS